MLYLCIDWRWSLCFGICVLVVVFFNGCVRAENDKRMGNSGLSISKAIGGGLVLFFCGSVAIF